MIFLKKIVVLVFFSAIPFLTFAQISSFGSPQYEFDDLVSDTEKQSTVVLPALDYSEIQKKQSIDNPLYSVPSLVDLSLEEDGFSYELSNGDRVWMLKIESTNGKGLGIFYENFYLPEGAKLYFFDEKKKQVKGAYTSKNNKESGRFFTGFIHNSVAYLEYYEPANVVGQGHFNITRIDQMLEKEGEEKELLFNFGFGTSSDCHENINCESGNAYQQMKKGVCRIMMVLEEGTGWCSGSLINNANNDETPYVLTAFHCQDSYTPLYDLWRFDFNYESENCDNPADEPNYQSLLGCYFRAGRQETDFLLLEIDQIIPENYGVYFNGWDRSDVVPSNMGMVHHPRGDIKKVSEDNTNLFIHPNAINWNNSVSTPANHHLRADLSLGSFEIGSSGSPFFDENGRIVAQLHGGVEGCTSADVYGGRLFYSWDEGSADSEKLQPWLDPDDTEVDFVDGLAIEGEGMAVVAGKVKTELGVGVGGVTVQVVGDANETMLTDASGNYSFELPIGGTYNITYEKNYGFTNGVTTSDLLKIRKVVLFIEDFESPYRIIAGNANGSSSTSTADIVTIKKIILALDDVFPNEVPSWRFVPSIYVFPDENNPFLSAIPNTIVIDDLQENILEIDIIGIKMGDVTVSANPSE